MAAIKTKEPKEATKEIIPAKRLPSGDILFLSQSENARIALEKSNDWLRAVAPTAKVPRTTFTVFVHGVRVQGIDTNDQIRTELRLYARRNSQLPSEARNHTSLMANADNNRARNVTARSSSKPQAPETANRIISQGLIHEGGNQNMRSLPFGKEE
jgi:hypothetical protein